MKVEFLVRLLNFPGITIAKADTSRTDLETRAFVTFFPKSS
jgi:hypothetical protein